MCTNQTKVLRLIREHKNTMQQDPCSYQQTGVEIKLFIDSKRNVLGTQNCFFKTLQILILFCITKEHNIIKMLDGLT